MKKIVPHMAIIIIYVGLILTAFITNSGFLGSVFGRLFALSQDPMIFLSALLLGLTFSEYRKFWLGIIVISPVILAVIHFIVLEYHEEIGLIKTPEAYMITSLMRFIAVVTIAHLSNILRVLIFSKSKI